MRRSRRQYLSEIAGGSALLASGLTARSVVEYVENAASQDDFPAPRIIYPEAEAWGTVTTHRDRSVTVTLSSADDQLIRRRVDPDSGQTVDVQEIESSSRIVDIAASTSETIDLIYRDVGDDEVEYLFDMPVSLQILLGIRRSVEGTTDNYYDRRFGDRAIEITFQWWALNGPTMSFRIPYSLYVLASASNPSGPIPTIVTKSDNGFDRYDHSQLIGALGEFLETLDGVDEAVYWEVATIAEFVQSIPHEIDWVSLNELHYVRTPAEMFVELTADCKDASVLLYDLLQEFDYDPVFILLVGNIAGDADDESSGSKNSGSKTSAEGSEKKATPEVKGPPDDVTLYPNHIAIGLPRDQLGEIPSTVGEDLTTFERAGEEYVYIESTERANPGLFQDPEGRSTAIIYENRRDMVSAVLGR